MRNLARRGLLCLMLIVGCPSFAFARASQSPPLFVSAGAFADVQRVNNSTSRSVNPTNTFIGSENDLSGTAAGGLVGAGAFLSPRISLQLEFVIPATRKKSLRDSQSIPTGTFFTRTTRDFRYRATTASVLAGYHPPEWHRLRPGVVGGLMFVAEWQRTISVSTSFPTGTTFSSDQTSAQYRTAAVVGLDTAVRLTSHVALVPQIRGTKFIGTPLLSVRPGVSACWRF